MDKTGYAPRLVEEGPHYFLVRPRRFGKSLFLDTLKELLEGSRDLFERLNAFERWDWSVRCPVVRLSFGSGNFKEPGYLHTNLMAQLDAIEEEAGVASRYDTGSERFGHLIRTLHRQTGQRVAVVVDGYDKPILDALEASDIGRANRDYLRGLYATIKDVRCSRPLLLPHYGEEVLQGQPFRDAVELVAAASCGQSAVVAGTSFKPAPGVWRLSFRQPAGLSQGAAQ